MFGVKKGELALMSSVLMELASWLWLCLLNPMLIMTQNSKTHNILVPPFSMAGLWSPKASS